MSGIQQNYLGIEIIAEAGCNHGGDLNVALEMVRVAASSGADTIKFQSFIPDKLVNADDVMEWCVKSQLGYEEHSAIIEVCEDEGIAPLFSAFDEESLEMIATLGMERVKIPSGQIFNEMLVEKAAIHFNEVYASTGMCSFADVRKAFYTMEQHIDRSDIVLMQCTTAYPSPPTARPPPP